MFTTRVQELDCLTIIGNKGDITLKSFLAVHFIIVFSGKTNVDEMKYAGVTLLIQLEMGEPHFCRCDTLSWETIYLSNELAMDSSTFWDIDTLLGVVQIKRAIFFKRTYFIWTNIQ